ncbi:MAG: hypothetical protein JSV33_09425 [bacterium]|nr:MAG: hypothetical protein JSV33_09425 [bacterium]
MFVLRNTFRNGNAIILVLLLAAPLLLNGCAPSRPKPPKENMVLDTETVVMLDHGVTTQLSRQKEWVDIKNGFMEPHIILRNRGGKTLFIEIRTYFKDKYGATIETPGDLWDPVSINPHEDYHYHRLCPKKSGISYQFHIRLGKAKH